MKLKNSEILETKEALDKLSKLKLPVRCSMQGAEIEIVLDKKIAAFAKVRDGLFTQYDIERKPSAIEGQVEFSSKQGEEALQGFINEFSELLNLEVEIVFEKMKLPEKIAATCDACHHNMDKPLVIESEILKPLVAFIEIV